MQLTTKQQEAIERQTAWAQLTPQEQLRELDKRLGINIGAVKQRRKLAKQTKVS